MLSEPDFLGEIPEREPLLVTPAFRSIWWDGSYPATKLATVLLDNNVEFHVPLTNPDLLHALPNLVKEHFNDRRN